MRDEEDVPAVCTDLRPRVPGLSWGFNPMCWPLGAGVVVAGQLFVIAALLGALMARW